MCKNKIQASIHNTDLSNPKIDEVTRFRKTTSIDIDGLVINPFDRLYYRLLEEKRYIEALSLCNQMLKLELTKISKIYPLLSNTDNNDLVYTEEAKKWQARIEEIEVKKNN